MLPLLPRCRLLPPRRPTVVVRADAALRAVRVVTVVAIPAARKKAACTSCSPSSITRRNAATPAIPAPRRLATAAAVAPAPAVLARVAATPATPAARRKAACTSCSPGSITRRNAATPVTPAAAATAATAAVLTALPLRRSFRVLRLPCRRLASRFRLRRASPPSRCLRAPSRPLARKWARIFSPLRPSI